MIESLLLAIYGLQARDDHNDDKRRLKFHRFKTFGFKDDDTDCVSKYSQAWSGRS